MNPQELFVFLRDLLRNNAEVIAAFLTGLMVALMLVYFFRHWVHSKRESTELGSVRHQLQAEQAKADTLNRIVKEKDERVLALSRECETLQEQLADTEAQNQQAQAGHAALKKESDLFRRKAVTVVTRYKNEAARLQSQVNEVEELEGKIWERPAKIEPPPFRPLEERGAPIIAVFNLKGGVGKTSLTAHIGASLWGLGKRVLLVDLDYQASLTHLVLPVQQVDQLKPGAKFVGRVLTAPNNHGQEAWNCVASINGGSGYLLAAHEDLSRVEEMTKAEWLVNATGREPRYALRAALHHDMFRRRFDYILLDCPPRLSMACVNALTACDFVLIPTLFDKTSREAVFRLLDLLRHLRQIGLCPNVNVLGVVGNKSYRKPSLTSREKTAWDQLKKIAKDHWQAEVHHFKRYVPSSRFFAEAAEKAILADQDPELKGLFAQLVQELEKEITKRASHAEGARLAATR